MALPVMGSDDPFADLTPLDAAHLEAARGGLAIGPYEVAVGLSVRTAVSGLGEWVSHMQVAADGSLVPIGGTAPPATEWPLLDGADIVPVLSLAVDADGARVPLPVTGNGPENRAHLVGGLAGNDAVRVHHCLGEGHQTLIENRLNDAVIAQTVTFTVTMENMSHINAMAQMGRQMDALAFDIQAATRR